MTELWTRAEAAAHCGVDPSRFSTLAKRYQVFPAEIRQPEKRTWPRTPATYLYRADEVRQMERSRGKQVRRTVSLSPDERAALKAIAGVNRTAQIVLLCADGLSGPAIALRLGCSKQVVSKHLDRWDDIGLDGVLKAHK